MSDRIPHGWKIQSLDSLASVNWGDTSLTKASYVAHGYPAYSASGFDGYLTNFQFDQDGMVLSAIGARCGRVFFATGKWTAIKNTITLLAKPEKSDIRFLYQYFSIPDHWDISGGAQPFIGLTNARKLEILHPPLPEQQKIAAILSSVDDVIEKTRAQIDKLKELKTGMMQELLTKGIGQDGKPHTEFKDSPVGKIPTTWEVDDLIALSTNGISNGVFNDPKKVGRGKKIINVYDMYQGLGVDISTLKLLDVKDNEFIKNKVEYGDIFFTRSSLKLEGIAYCNINLSNDADITYDGHLMRIRPDQARVNPKYLAQYCLADYSRKFFMAAAKHSTMTTIGQADIAPLKVVLPPLSEQHKIVAVIDSIETKTRTITARLQQVVALKKALMQDLLTGKVRVNIEEKEAAVG